MTDALILEPGLWVRGSLMTFSATEADLVTAFIRSFPDLPSGAPFAADLFGDVWMVLNDGTVVFVHTETFELGSGEPSFQFETLDAWTAAVMDDPDGLLGAGIAGAWASANGAIPEGCRLCGKTPFVLGGSYDVGDLHCADFKAILRFRAELARQIRDLPDGSTILFDVSDD